MTSIVALPTKASSSNDDPGVKHDFLLEMPLLETKGILLTSCNAIGQFISVTTAKWAQFLLDLNYLNKFSFL